MTFFLAQEELAFAFELLGLYDEALVQYDELDALFSQFVQNAHLDSLPFWLQNLIDKCDSWHSLYLSNQVSFQLREKIKESNGSFLELRNYLFARQCELLLLQHMPWQVATRSLPFLQNCVNELRLLEIKLQPGAVDCWVFLSASEILLICERYNDSSQMDSYSKNTIDVRAYSRRKLEVLGKICGLVPGMQSTSDHLHNVISLIAGMGKDHHHSDPSSTSAQSRLKEALSNSDVYLKNYLEFSELTMGTYKHIGRMREARLIGKELAEIYIKLENYQLALSFLLDLEKIFALEQWQMLLSDIRKKILECYEKLNDQSKQVTYCFYLASSLDLPTNERDAYFAKLENLVKQLKPTDEPIKIRMNNVFDAKSIRISSQNRDFITNFDINFNVQLNNNLIRPLTCRRAYFNLQFSQNNQEKKKELFFNELKNNELCTELSREGLLERPIFDSYLDTSVGIMCKNLHKVLKRFDSQFQGKDILVESELSFQNNNSFTLQPDLNDLNLKFNTQHNGIYSLDQFCLFVEPNVYFLNNEIKQYSFEIISQQPSLELKIINEHLNCLSDELVCGVEQRINILLNSGSNYFSKSTRFDFKSSTGLRIRLVDSPISTNEITNHELPFELKPFETYVFKLMVYCEFGEQRSSDLITKKLELFVNNDMKLNCPLLHFSPPFYSTMTLHTCSMKKFVQISLTSNSLLKFDLNNPKLECVLNGDDEGDRISKTNGVNDQLECEYLSQQSTSCIQNEQTVHLMWKIVLTDTSANNFKLRFSLNYDLDPTNYKTRLAEDDKIAKIDEENHKVNGDLIEQQVASNLYKCDFFLKEFTTLFMVRISVSPQTNSEFIRAGNLCSLTVKIKRNLNIDLEKTAIMYELVSDRTLWAINGKTAGVLDNVEDEHELNFEVLPLIAGFIPVPSIRLSKYIRQDQATDPTKTPSNTSAQNSNVKLVAFDSGQIYNYSRGIQVNVLQSSGLILTD